MRSTSSSSAAGTEAVNPQRVGTKAAARFTVSSSPRAQGHDRSPPARSRRDGREPLRPRLRRRFRRSASPKPTNSTPTVIPTSSTADAADVMRQAFAGLLWSKQFYHYDVSDVAARRPDQPPPPAERLHGRNSRLDAPLQRATCMSMPDKWEYPWYAAWDLAFHCVAVGARRSDFAKAPAEAAAARVVHAPERADSRLRVGVRRRESAGARLGGVARLQDRASGTAARATRSSSSRSSTSCC